MKTDHSHKSPSVPLSQRGKSSRPPSAAGCAFAILAAVAFASPAVAHGPERKPPDLVWLQGFRAASPPPAGAHEVQLIARGKPHQFFATDWRHYSVSGGPALPAPDPQTPLFLQAAPEVLARFEGAGPKDKVSILAEWRPGRRDLFVQVLDVCVAP